MQADHLSHVLGRLDILVPPATRAPFKKTYLPASIRDVLYDTLVKVCASLLFILRNIIGPWTECRLINNYRHCTGYKRHWADHLLHRSRDILARNYLHSCLLLCLLTLRQKSLPKSHFWINSCKSLKSQKRRNLKTKTQRLPNQKYPCVHRHPRAGKNPECLLLLSKSRPWMLENLQRMYPLSSVMCHHYSKKAQDGERRDRAVVKVPWTRQRVCQTLDRKN